ncbi:hypothetical protein V3C40_27870 [Janthinobacterium sp. LS2A]|uniref:hypothetical protein n=1 Tax=Janthinobacterium sp. LS2A TaxID=3118590 RepID=UPI002F934E93
MSALEIGVASALLLRYNRVCRHDGIVHNRHGCALPNDRKTACPLTLAVTDAPYFQGNTCMSSATSSLVGFVGGQLDTAAFEHLLYEDAETERLLSAQPAPRYAHAGHTLYHYLISLDLHNPADVLNAQGALAEFLHAAGIPLFVSEKPGQLHALLLAAQPKWLDVDLAYVAALLDKAPPHAKKSERTQWLRAQLLALFRYAKKPPRWLQAPNWPIEAHGPLVFLGQLPVDGYFHDEAAVYVFYDASKNECRSILQTC